MLHSSTSQADTLEFISSVSTEFQSLLRQEKLDEADELTLCIHQLFERQVERTPNTVAVSFEGQQLTYRELNDRANQLAHYLQALAVSPEVLVGICIERRDWFWQLSALHRIRLSRHMAWHCHTWNVAHLSRRHDSLLFGYSTPGNHRVTVAPGRGD